MTLGQASSDRIRTQSGGPFGSVITTMPADRTAAYVTLVGVLNGVACSNWPLRYDPTLDADYASSPSVSTQSRN
jgi:hypothetical protein